MSETLPAFFVQCGQITHLSLWCPVRCLASNAVAHFASVLQLRRMAAETVCLGTVTEHAPQAYSWSVSKLFEFSDFTVVSPAFEIRGQQFCLVYTPILEGNRECVDITLKAVAARYGYASISFSLTMACQNRMVAGLPRSLNKLMDGESSTNSGTDAQHFIQTDLCGVFDIYLITLKLCSFEGPAVGLTDSLLLSTPVSASHLAQFYRSEDLSDCLVSTEDGRAFPTHKLALASASPVLKAMFTSSSSMQDASDSKITIKEAAPAVVELLLQFMYGLPEVLVPVSLAVSFFKLADQYQVAAAADALTKVICEDVTLNPDAVCHLLPQATQLGSVGTLLSQHLASRAALIHKDLALEEDSLQRWRLQDVQHVVTVMQLNRIEHVVAQGLGQKVEAKQQDSIAYSSIKLAATWALAEARRGGTGADAAGTAKYGTVDRVQVWKELQDKLAIADIKKQEVRELIAEPGKPLQELPGLAAAVLEVLVSRP